MGEDQYQHLELARDIAQLFNSRFCSADAPVFPLPRTVAPPGQARRIMSLRDASKKMSKSDPHDDSRINLTDEPDVVRYKIRKSKTDSHTGFAYDELNRPEKSNLLTIHSALSGESIEELTVRHASTSALDFKNELADVIISSLSPIQRELKRLTADQGHIHSVLSDGAKQARTIAALTMEKVRSLSGIL